MVVNTQALVENNILLKFCVLDKFNVLQNFKVLLRFQVMFNFEVLVKIYVLVKFKVQNELFKLRLWQRIRSLTMTTVLSSSRTMLRNHVQHCERLSFVEVETVTHHHQRLEEVETQSLPWSYSEYPMMMS